MRENAEEVHALAIRFAEGDADAHLILEKYLDDYTNIFGRALRPLGHNSESRKCLQEGKYSRFFSFCLFYLFIYLFF